MNTAPPRIVLDTNACLDLWVFGDAGAAGLLAALQAGALQAVTNTSCRDEWLRVLLYPQLQLTDAVRATLADTYDAMVHCIPDDSPPLRVGRVPRCADPDD